VQQLDDQVAVITGGGRGIGVGIAEVLGAEGARIALLDIDPAQAEATRDQLRKAGVDALAVAADVTSGASMNDAISAVVDRWGRIDILAANAGVYPRIALESLTVDAWDQVMDINLKGALLSIQACLPAMTSRSYGRIVLTSSITGPITGQPGYAHYGATKAGMLGLMRSVALELAGRGITVNAVQPGNVSTPGFAELGAEHERRMLAAIPLHRFAEPADVGWAVRFLASPEAGYITGQTIVVDGGQVLPESD
jgi:3-oxoacyl-[acyl-carrier protein] reductase